METQVVFIDTDTLSQETSLPDDYVAAYKLNDSINTDTKQEVNAMEKRPISLWVGNLRKYTEGELDGEWLHLPMNDKDLDEALSKISEKYEDEMIICDKNVREDLQYLYGAIGEYDNVKDINTVAKLIGDNPHPAAQVFMEYSEDLSWQEIANLFLKEDELAYFPYDFEGCHSEQVMSVLSSEEKLGYTVIESNPALKTMLEDIEVGTSTLDQYINVEAIGRDMILSGYVHTGEFGYYDKRADAPDLMEYTMEEINQTLKEEHLEVEKQMEQAPILPVMSAPKGPKL